MISYSDDIMQIKSSEEEVKSILDKIWYDTSVTESGRYSVHIQGLLKIFCSQ